MSDYMEIIHPQSMTAKLYKNGEVIAEYKVEKCDHCEKIMRFDEFGFQKGIAREKLLWFCGSCR